MVAFEASQIGCWPFLAGLWDFEGLRRLLGRGSAEPRNFDEGGVGPYSLRGWRVRLSEDPTRVINP